LVTIVGTISVRLPSSGSTVGRTLPRLHFLAVSFDPAVIMDPVGHFDPIPEFRSGFRAASSNAMAAVLTKLSRDTPCSTVSRAAR